MSNLKIFSGRSHPELARKAAEHLGIKLGAVEITTFPCTETFCQYQENIRGSDLYIIQPTNGSDEHHTNDNFMELCIMIDAAKRASAEHITAVIPYFGYARQDRKDSSRAPISAKLITNFLTAAGANRVITMDLHAPQIQGFFDIPCDHLYFSAELYRYIETRYRDHDIVVVSPDSGAIKKADNLAKAYNKPMAFISKTRLNATEVVQNGFVGDVKGKTACIIDDLTESCGTLIGAANVCLENGAERVITCVTHGCLSPRGMSALEEALKDGVIADFITSDTIDVSAYSTMQGVTVISVASVFARAIRCVHDKESVSALFR